MLRGTVGTLHHPGMRNPDQDSSPHRERVVGQRLLRFKTCRQKLRTWRLSDNLFTSVREGATTNGGPRDSEDRDDFEPVGRVQIGDLSTSPSRQNFKLLADKRHYNEVRCR